MDHNRNYLDRHLEKKFWSDEEKSEKYLNYEITLKKPEGYSPIRYNHTGTVEHRIKNLHIQFSYTPVPDDIFFRMTKEPEIGVMPIVYDIDRTHWRFLSSLKLENDRHALEITKLSEEYPIVININPENSDNAYADTEREVIIVPYDMRSPASVLICLHEIGHIKDYQHQKDDYSKEQWRTTYKNFTNQPNKWADRLKQERNAWAFALRTYKPFIQDATTIIGNDIVINFAHNCLRSYSDDIKKKMLAHGWSTDSDEKVKEAIEKEKEENLWKDKFLKDWEELF